MFEHFGSCAEGKSDSSFSWTFLQGFLAKSRKKRFLSPCSVHTMENMLPPASSEQCLTFEIPFSPSSSLSQTLIPCDDFNQGLFWSILCFVTQLLLHHRTAPVPSLPSLCSCQGSWFDFPDSWAGWAALLPCLACRWSFLGASLIISSALEVLKLSDITFEMQYPKPARPQLEDFVRHSLEQNNYFTSFWLSVWVCSSQSDISLLWNRRTLLSHVQLVIQHSPYYFFFCKTAECPVVPAQVQSFTLNISVES